MKFAQFLNEMASSRKFSSGYLKSKDAINLVKAFKNGEETFDYDDGRKFSFKKTVAGNKLEKGMLVLGSYNSTNQGAHLYEIKGFTDDKKAYGEGGVKFDSVKEVFEHYGVNSLKELNALTDENEYGHGVYLHVKDLESGDEGPWFYLYKGRWVQGSGAEYLSFSLVEEVK